MSDINPKVYTGPGNDDNAVVKAFGRELTPMISKLADVYPTKAQGQKMAERMVKIALSQVTKDQNLRRCTPQSMYLALFEAAQMGLDFGVSGEAYIVPYKNTAQFQIGYKGLIKLARQSNDIRTVEARPVHSGDVFKVKLGLEPDIIHEVDYREDRGEVIAFYAVATLSDGLKQFEVMSKSEIDKVKDASQAAKSQYSPWNTFYSEMGKKTVIKRLLKLLPSSIEMASAIEYDNKEYTEIIDITPIEEPPAVAEEPKKEAKPKRSSKKAKPAQPETKEDDIPLHQSDDPGPIAPDEVLPPEKPKPAAKKKTDKTEAQLRDEISKLADELGPPIMATLLGDFEVNNYLEIPAGRLEEFIEAQIKANG